MHRTYSFSEGYAKPRIAGGIKVNSTIPYFQLVRLVALTVMSGQAV
jgi:hypothetical protein